jgi:hypothetical protein
MRDATGNTRNCRMSCAASSGQRVTSSIRSALYSTTTAQHGTDAIHKMQPTTGAAACSKRTRNRQQAADNAMHGMRDETKGSRTLAHLGAASGSHAGHGGSISDFADALVEFKKARVETMVTVYRYTSVMFCASAFIA